MTLMVFGFQRRSYEELELIYIEFKMLLDLGR